MRPRNARRLIWLGTKSAAMVGGTLVGIASAIAADFELGRYLAAECMTCHRSATSTSTIPNIFGREETHLSNALSAYRDKRLPNPVMQTVAGRLSDEEIASLALYFSKTKQPQ